MCEIRLLTQWLKVGLPCVKYRSCDGQSAASPTLSWDLGMHPLEDCHHPFHSKTQGSKKEHVTDQRYTNAPASGSQGSVEVGSATGDTPATPTVRQRTTKELFSIVEEKWMVAAGSHLCPSVSFECQAYGSVSL